MMHRLRSTAVLAIAALAASGLLISCDKGDGQGGAGPQTLTVFCGAGIQPAMDELKTAFEQQNDCTVVVSYEGSGTLLGRLQSGAAVDAYVPGDIFWIKKAQGKNLIGSYEVVAWFVPVLAVQNGNDKQIKGLADLAREDVRVGLGNPEACAVGEVARSLLGAAGLSDRVKPRYEGLTVNQLANQVKLKALDVALVWDATAAQYKDSVDVVPIKDSEFHAVPFAVGIVKGSANEALAKQFATFAASDEGAAIFRRHEYTVPGKMMRLGCGSSMRPAVEDLAALFNEEYGVDVQPNYGGSGTVLLQIEKSKQGDVYICHDPYAYVCEQRKLSASWHTMAYLKPVIAVRKGNPKNKKIRGLLDLLRDDVRVGLPQREASTRGMILWTILEKHKLADKMTKHGFVEDRTHALTNKLKLDAVDAAVLWDAPSRATEGVEVVPIEAKYEVDAVTSATSGKTYDVSKVKVTVVRLTLSKEPLLTAQFAKMCLGDRGREILRHHKFVLPKR